MADSSPLPTTAESTPATQPDVKLSRPKMLLKLKSVNGASNSMKNVSGKKNIQTQSFQPNNVRFLG